MGSNQEYTAYGWKIAQLEDLCDLITDGSHNSPKDHPGGLPMASVKDLTRSGINISGCRTISEIDFERLVRNGCQPLYGDVLIAKDGATCLDTVCEYKQQDKIVLLSSIAILRPGSHLYSGYLRYYLDSSETKAFLKSGYVSGSAIPRVVLKDFKRAPIPVPPLPEQRAIAHILGALDDKIELNQRMNETLESMTRAIFKSWFVDFDPVRAKMEGRKPYGMDDETAALFPNSLENSALGEIPQGWRVGTLGEVVAINERSITKAYPYQTIKYIDISSVTEGRLEETTSYALSEAPSRARRLVKHGDTIWSTVRPNRKSYLFISNPEDNLVVSTGFVVLTPHSIPPSYLYPWVTTDQFVDYLAYNADGSAYPAVLPGRFADAKILLPSSEILQEFEKLVGLFRARIAQNEEEARTLALIRDTLLPKLLSGEIRIKTVEKVSVAHI